MSRRVALQLVVTGLLAAGAWAQTAVPPAAAPPQVQTNKTATALRPAEVETLRPVATLERATTAEPDRVARLLASRRAKGRLQRGFLREFTPRAVDLGGKTMAAAQPDAVVHRAGTGEVVWTGKVTVAGAFALRLGLSAVELPRESRLFVYAPGGEPVEFGLEMMSSRREIWCPSISGETVVLEVHVPASAVDHGKAAARFTVRGVIEGFPFESETRAIGTDSFNDCDVDPTCNAASVWEELGDGLDVRKAIAYLEYVENNATYICSGGLLNNRPTSLPAYLLTANHCFSTQDSASSLVAYFDYQSPTCGGSASPGSFPSTTGATLLATNATNDFTFVQLSGTVPSANGRVYLGWSAGDPLPDEVVYRLHHPGGGPLSFSATAVDDTGTFSCSAASESEFIYSLGLEGATVGGSSGAPALLWGGYVIGQLLGTCGVPNLDPCDYTDYATLDGRFSSTYWEILPWLDPIPENLVATAQSPTSVALTWNDVADVPEYKVWRYDGAWSVVGTTTQTSYTDSTAQSGAAYLYCVQSLVNGGTSVCSDADLATTVMFNDSLVGGSTKIQSTHLVELRTAANAVRVLAGLAAASFTGGASGDTVKASDITDLRTALDAGMDELGFATGGYTTTPLTNTPVRAVHFQEIRNRVR